MNKTIGPGGFVTLVQAIVSGSFFIGGINERIYGLEWNDTSDYRYNQ